MADDAIGAAGNHFLTRLDLNRPRSETVDLRDPECHYEPTKNDCLRKDRDPQRLVRPTESVIETGQNKSNQPYYVDEHHDAPLLAYLLPELHPSLDQLRIVLVEVRESEDTGHKRSQDIDPALPKPEGTSGDEKQSPDYDYRNQETKSQLPFEAHPITLPWFESRSPRK